MENESNTQDTKEKGYRAEFENLPLDEKYARLFELEGLALTETFACIVDSSDKVIEQASVAISDFAKKFEVEARETFRQAKHATACDDTSGKSEPDVRSETPNASV